MDDLLERCFVLGQFGIDLFCSLDDVQVLLCSRPRFVGFVMSAVVVSEVVSIKQRATMLKSALQARKSAMVGAMEAINLPMHLQERMNM